VGPRAGLDVREKSRPHRDYIIRHVDICHVARTISPARTVLNGFSYTCRFSHLGQIAALLIRLKEKEM
jgi:hypothetical protein